MNNSIHDHSMKIKEALQHFFEQYHFENGGYDLNYFKIKVGSFYITLPNSKSRVATAKLHDIHHVLTGYPATLKGEAEIGAWEIASGCDRYFIAWFFNCGAFFYGLFFYPKAIFKAFMRGKQCNTNLYHENSPYNKLLDNNTEALRTTLGINKNNSNSLPDYLSFIFWCVLILSPAILIICCLFSLF